MFTATIFGHKIPVPIMFAPIGINKLYSPLGELVPARVAGELGMPVSSELILNQQTLASNSGCSVLPVHCVVPAN